VYGYITYNEGITPALTTEMALATLIGFGLVYFVVYASGFRYILKTVRQGTEID
jgi:cytochrome bd-type quinol oxidase subunit 1